MTISWAKNADIDDEVTRTVIRHRPQGTTAYGTFVNLKNFTEVVGDRYVATVPGIGAGDEVLMRVKYDHLGQTKFSDPMIPTPASPDLDPIAEHVEEFWSLEANGVVLDNGNRGNGARAIAVAENTVFVGGDFRAAYKGDQPSVTRDFLAAFDRTTGDLTSFNPGLNGVVRALAISEDGNTLYVGGNFSQVGTTTTTARRNMAAFDVATGDLLDDFNPRPNGGVFDLEVDGNTLYVGGSFTVIDGQDSGRMARFDNEELVVVVDDEERVVGWGPEVNETVRGIAVDDNGMIWIGGDFTQVDNNASAKFLAVLNANGSLAFDVKNPQRPGKPAATVIDLVHHDGRVFVAGGGRGGIGIAYDINNDLGDGHQAWFVETDGNVQAVDAAGDWVYFGGHWDYLESYGDDDAKVRAERMTRHNVVTSALDHDWTHSPSGERGINAIHVADDGLYVAGDFTNLRTSNGVKQEGWAVFAGDAAAMP